MKVILTNRQEITSKKGEKFTILRGIGEDGGTVEAFLSGSQAEDFEVSSLPVVSKAELKQMFEDFDLIAIEFNQRGRVVGVSKD